MKKIQLSDGMPIDIQRKNLNITSVELLKKVKKLCVESDLSYVEINKALYLVDKELYMEKISS
ncbi:hypothetical protein SAMN04487821_101276 [Enterococcus malodoratus]|uniref:hypothetical protein n=1 Tax=Enterococcus malodoratus TaxID=71451 RepID=UPI0008C34E04|nr:hypothetical protein [Enterococcus malodoratus]SES67832.1 hypothetical protein SAMN04487821_101276 [Enterococcus malodoratus]